MRFKLNTVCMALVLSIGLVACGTEQSSPLSDSGSEAIDNSNGGNGTGGTGPGGSTNNPDPVAQGPVKLGFQAVESEVNEGGESHDIMISLSRASDEAITLDYQIASDTAVVAKDFEMADGSLTIEPGATEAKLSVKLIDDKFFELDKSFSVTIENLSGADQDDNMSHTVVIMNDDIPTEEDVLFGKPKGPEQLKIVCDRMAELNAINQVTTAFCGDTPPVINNIKDLQRLLGFEFNPNSTGRNQNGANGNPGFTLTGHSSSLVMQFVNPINPRALIFTPPSNNVFQTQSVTAMGFVRGEQFVEIITSHFNPNDPNDPQNGSLQFFLFNFEQECNVDHSCTNGDLLTDKIESNWTGYTLLHEEDLKNTVLDCRQCHQSEGPETQKAFLMQELNAPWTHFFRDNREVGTALVADYQAAHGTDEEYAGIPGQFVVTGSDPALLEDLIKDNGFGNGFDFNSQLGRFDTTTIEQEVNASSPAQPQDNTTPGVSATWQALYEQNVRGEIIQVPYHDAKVTDPVKVAELTQAYIAYKNGDITELPDIRQAFRDDEIRDIGFKVKEGLDGEGIMIQACTQCHNAKLDQNITRAKFDVDLSKMSVEALQTAQERVVLEEEHLLVMPPKRFRTLDEAERKLLNDYLQSVIDQKLAAQAAAKK